MIATAEELCDSTAWVRCFDADPNEMSVDERCRVRVAFPSSTTQADRGTAYRMRQKDLPSDALWLICESEDLEPPAHDWGDKPESFVAAPRQYRQQPEKEHLEQQLNRLRKERWAMWSLMGVLAPGALLAISLTILSGAANMAVMAVSISWLCLAVVAGAVSGLAAARNKWLTRKWRKREGFEEDEWVGGTARVVLLDGLLRQVSFRREKGWSDLWPSAWPQAGDAEDPKPGGQPDSAMPDS